MRFALRLLLLPALALAACGDGGTRESACSVRDNGDGTRTIRCGEDELLVPGSGDGTTCVKSPSADGGAVVACTDGTTIVLDADGNVVHRGAGGVVGRVTLFGETEDHSGTTVRAVGTEQVATTDEKGDFYLAGLDAGVYDLLVEREGWEPIRHRNTIAVGGILYLEPLLLRRGRQVAGASESVYVSPAEDTLLVQQGRALWLHPVDRLAPVELSPNAVRLDDPIPGTLTPTYSPDGTAVLFLENLDPASLWGRVRRYEVASGAVETLSERAVEFAPVAGGPALLWRAPAEVVVGPVSEADVVLRYPDGAELALGRTWVAREQAVVEPGGRAVALYGLEETVVVDVASRKIYEPGSGTTVVAWSPDGQKVVLAAPELVWGQVTLLLLDLGAGSLTPLASGAYYQPNFPTDAVSFNHDGSKLLFLGRFEGLEGGETGTVFRGDLQVVDTRTLEPVVAPEASRSYVGWRFSPDGASVLYQRGAQTLIAWDVARARTMPLGVTWVEAVAWSARGDRLAFPDADGSCRLVRYDADGTPGLFAVPSCQEIHFLPDGERTAVVVWNEGAKRDLRIWDGGEPGPPVAELPGQTTDPQLRFSPDGGTALWVDRSAGLRDEVRVRDLIGGTTAVFPESVSYQAGFSPDGTFAVAVSGSLSELLVLELATGTITRIDGPLATFPQLYRDFALYPIADDEEAEESRAGTWLSRFPRTPAP